MNNLSVNTTLDDNLTSTESTIDLEIKCNLLKNLTESQPKKGIYCDVFFDSLVCWPKTAALKTAVRPCFSYFNGYLYDSSKNATKLCLANGTWDSANYDNCKSLNNVTQEENLVKDLSNIKETSKIFLFGYGISLIVLIIALFIFLYFKELKCMRNRIHTNLIIAYILLHILWIITFENLFIVPGFHCILFLFLNYFLTTTYFWMFVEGLYLYLLVMQTFSVDKLPLYFYNLIGWGVPSILLFIIWTPLKYVYGVSRNNMVKCKLIEPDDLDYIYIVPILIVLLLNIFFMFVIIYVLITKLRVSNSAESQQYRKATKAMLVLIPLLGAFYLFLIVPPKGETTKIIFLNIRAALLSTQGLFVAILYCFLNGEVKSCIKNHLERWKEIKKFNSRPNVNKGSASSGSTLLPPINENENTLDSNDLRIKIPLLRGQQLQDFNNPFYNSSPNNDHLKSIFKQTHNSDLKHNFGCFNPE